MLESSRVKQGATTRITAVFVDAAGIVLAGLAPTIRIRRRADGWWWNASAFQAALADNAMIETDAINMPGLYHYGLPVPAGQAGQEYDARCIAAAANSPQLGELIIVEADESNLVPLSGARSVSVNCTASSVPVPSAVVTIRNSADTQTLGVATANSSGVAALSLDDGAYVLRLARLGVATWAPYTLVVAGDMTVTIDGTPVSITTPSGPSWCVVYVYTSVAEAATAWWAELADPPKKAGGAAVLVQPRVDFVVTQAGARQEAQLAQGLDYLISAPRYGVSRMRVTTPTASSAELLALLGI